MKTITQEQIKVVMKTMQDLNIPIQTYLSLQDFFDKLPVVEAKNEKK